MLICCVPPGFTRGARRLTLKAGPTARRGGDDRAWCIPPVKTGVLLGRGLPPRVAVGTAVLDGFAVPSGVGCALDMTTMTGVPVGVGTAEDAADCDAPAGVAASAPPTGVA